jgi:TATA-box binding protein (TBP) (component of TFIID and TFIIIB)
VNIKFVPSDSRQGKKVSIFVFESGNIIITGAKTVNNILESYNYIKDFMNDHKSSVQKSKICEMLRNNISDEINGMLQIDDDDDLLALALSEANVNL